MINTEALVHARMNNEVVSADAAKLQHPSGSEITIRLAGGYMEDLRLVPPTKRRPRTPAASAIFYCDRNANLPKRAASHLMSPAGPSEGLGGQHGAGRWLDWHQFQLDDSMDGSRRTAFQAKRSDNGETLLRYIELGASHVQLESIVRAPFENIVATSIGEHFYFSQQGDVRDVALNGKSLDWFFDDDQAFEKLEEGEPLVKQVGTLNLLAIDLPELPTVTLQTQVTGGGIGHYFTELWVWKRPGSEGYLCIEPVVGVQRLEGQPANNQMLTIPSGASATLTSRLGLLAA